MKRPTPEWCGSFFMLCWLVILGVLMGWLSSPRTHVDVDGEVSESDTYAELPEGQASGSLEQVPTVPEMFRAGPAIKEADRVLHRARSGR